MFQRGDSALRLNVHFHVRRTERSSEAIGVNVHADVAVPARDWTSWPLAMMPMALIGVVLASRVWNARAGEGGSH